MTVLWHSIIKNVIYSRKNITFSQRPLFVNIIEFVIPELNQVTEHTIEGYLQVRGNDGGCYCFRTCLFRSLCHLRECQAVTLSLWKCEN